MTEFKINPDAPILVEFLPGQGEEQGQWEVEPVSAKKLGDNLQEMSANAVQSAMDTIHNMADKIAATVKRLAASPSEVEVTFGLKFDAKAGVLIASTGLQASVQIKLKWKQG
ncbi:MAG: hypothetical protein KJ621_03365 [Proteobacteria bacterium]|nr:hypothetical protein [Pseudomonadota bacterium]